MSNNTSDHGVASTYCSNIPQIARLTARLKGRRILVVEDEVLVGLDLELALESAGAIVIGPAMTLKEALALANEGGADAAVLDVDLAGTDVYPAADVLKEKKVPFVFHTGHGDRAELGNRYDDCPVCQKPTPTEVLLMVVAALIEEGKGDVCKD